jgi:3-oxoacyl-[acyl-carrier protein] reductase
MDGIALVTGASRGIGRHLALGLAGAGYPVALAGRDTAALAAVAAEVDGPAVVVPADVTDAAAVRESVATAERELGPVGLLVNNAGLIDPAEPEVAEADPETWWRVVEVNLRGPFHYCRAVLPGMIARGGGRIVNINTSMAMHAVPHYSSYSVSKAGLARLTDSIVAEAGGRGVRAFDLSPGTVRTDMTGSMPMLADREEWADPRHVVDVVAAIGRGELDALSGRYLHAVLDDLDRLRELAAGIAAADARTLRLRPYGPDDPFASY